MKKRRNKFLDIRVQFFFICMAGFIGVALLAALAAWGLEHLGVNVPMFVWLLIFTLLLGSATAAGFSIAFFAPISRLSRAMKEVAGGNFRVHVETKSVFRDIRDSFDSFNLMVSELNATETLQTDFISNVSHEFKTPISAIEGYASLLQEHQQSPEEQAEYIDKILFNTRRLSALAGNILLLSKLDSQSIHPQRSCFRLDEQVRQCILALERKWTEKDVDFDVDLDSVDFTGYEGLLQHVWMNLIDNAVKFGPRGGLIRMRLIEEDGSVLFTIDNEGKSIPDEDKSRIFNKFYQGDSSHESEGNGLGLALVRKIVADNCFDLHEVYPELSNKLLGEVLLTPTKIYVRQVLEVIRNCDVHGISHITGGGFDENIPRILHDGQGLEIDEGAWEILPVFRFLEKYGKVAHREMFNIFNMGIGMVIALDASEADKAIGILTAQGEKASVIGRVTDAEGVVIR